MARYYCNICHLFDDEPGRDIYHCPFCNFCRQVRPVACALWVMGSRAVLGNKNQFASKWGARSMGIVGLKIQALFLVLSTLLSFLV